MSLFHPHKHTYRLISAQNETGTEYSYVLGKIVDTYYQTIIVDICDECKYLRTRHIDGHHAANILAHYEESKDEDA